MNALPSFYDPSAVGTLYMERAGLVAAEALAWARTRQLTPASEDTFRIAVFGIDCQSGFCIPGASLFVPGAVEDTTRAVEWLYRNMKVISHLSFSLDTHAVHQVFHPGWWVDEAGNHPAPFTPITAEDVEMGRWRPVHAPGPALEYVQKLAEGGKYVLTIWPYHVLLGGASHTLVPALMEASIFHAVARKAQTRFELKGEAELTENYSVFSPEVTELVGIKVGMFNQALFDHLMSFDRIYVFGQASSHCVLSTLQDLRRAIEATHPEWMEKIYVLEDAMSPVPAPPLDPLPEGLNFPALARAGLDELARAGMKIVRTSDPVEV